MAGISAVALLMVVVGIGALWMIRGSAEGGDGTIGRGVWVGPSTRPLGLRKPSLKMQ